MASVNAGNDKLDAEGYPIFYLRGEMSSNQWGVDENYRFTRNDKTYTITLSTLDGQFKISGTEWQYNLGGIEKFEFNDAATFKGIQNGLNYRAVNLKDVTIRFTLESKPSGSLPSTIIMLDANGHKATPITNELGLSNTLPVLYINVYNEKATGYDDEIIDPYLNHKNYFAGEYWLDVNGCEWLAAEGAENIGTKDSPLLLEIKARGNYTRTAFAKKPFKIKLEKKQKLLGMSNSKHFTLLAHADDNFGYLRNFVGFNLGKRIGLPWTPSQQPVELVINGNYRGLYFLTESIRIDKDRVNIAELNDYENDASLISGGYIVELDNYDEANQIRMVEESCVNIYKDLLRITWDTPEEYSELQKRFITDQFVTINKLVGDNNNDLWSYLDLDDAVRYYLVEEIISHTEAYHGSTYLFRDRGEGQKWHFSPLWDCGNAFNGSSTKFFYNNSPFGNTWIPSIRTNLKFNNKLKETWMWFMTSRFNGLKDDIEQYVTRIEAAAKCDRERWKNVPVVVSPIADNSDIHSRKKYVFSHLDAKINWLKTQFGDYTLSGDIEEPQRDKTLAAPLPGYAKGDDNAVQEIEFAETPMSFPIYYNLQGQRISTPQSGEIYIVVTATKTYKTRY